MTFLLSAFAALVLLTVPTAAMAQAPQTNAPPGNSAIDEYLETVPGATGDRRPNPGATGGDSATGGLTPAQRTRLERRGADGKALADAVDAAPPASASAGTQKQTAPPPTAEGRSPVREVLDAARGGGGDGGGMGPLLPAILLASLLAVIALVVMHRRATS